MTKSSTGAMMAFDLDRTADTPLYRQIIDRLRHAIVTGQLTAGSRLPSTRALATDWDVSRNTVLQVFEVLTQEGYLDARVGAGTYVAHALPSEGAKPWTALAASPLGRNGYPFRTLSQRGRTLIEQSLGGQPERPTPFMPDVPDLQAFPVRSWLRLMNEVSGRLTGDLLVHVSNAGYEPLREAVAHHLRTARGIPCKAAQVIVTTGSQQSLDLVTRLLLENGDPVWMEEPGYVGARAALLANGCNVLPVPTDKDGMDIELGRRRFPTPRLVFISPARQYPLGATLSNERRAALIEFSHVTGAWILEDDYDCDFRYVGQMPTAVQSGDRNGRIVHIGTFSKTLLPSFRLGYVVVPKDLAPDFAKARAVVDRHASIMEQMVLAEFMHRGLYAAHLRRMRTLYRERQQTMIGVLQNALRYCPPEFECAGGMHFSVPLRSDVDDFALARSLWDRRIVCRPLSIYYAGRKKRSGLLLGFAAYTPDEITAAGEHLRLVAASVASNLA